MKFKLLTTIIFSCITSTLLANSAMDSPSGRLTDIVPGAGFSTDTQQVSKDVCFNSNIISETGQQGRVRLDSSMTFSQLQNEFSMNVNVAGNVGQFSINAESSYFRSLEETNYSFALNYFQYMYNTARLQINGVGRAALNTNGLGIYDNIHEYFGLRCGDNYITSFRQGAELIMSINLRFASRVEQERFKAAAGVSYGNIIQAAATIERVSSANRINGTVIIQAYQKGGDPSQLARILNRNDDGYYALQCSLQDMGSCANAASGLLDYAVEHFSDQVSFVPPTRGLVPLSIAFANYDPVRYLGLTPSPSLVTPEVVQNRLLLGRTVFENQYYQRQFDQLLGGYVVPLDPSSNLYRNSQTLMGNATGNIEIIRSAGNPRQGALACFDFPDDCSRITQNLQSQLRPILPSQLTYLNDIQRVVRFTNPANWGTWYGSGDNNAMLPLAGSIFRDGRMLVTIPAINEVRLSQANGRNYVGTLPAVGGGYSGRLCWNTTCSNVTATTLVNPFYFGVYQPSKKNKDSET